MFIKDYSEISQGVLSAFFFVIPRPSNNEQFPLKRIAMYQRRENRQKSLLYASNPYLHSHCASLFMTHWGPFSGVIAGAGPLKWEQQPRYMQPCQAPRVSLGQLETRGILDQNK